MITQKLLSPGFTNAKTAKNERLSYILYLSPHKQNSHGLTVCPKATDGCINVCLVPNSGRAVVFNRITEARIKKTDFYFADRIGFLTQLNKELFNANKLGEKLGKKIAIRLNGGSDLDFFTIIKNRINVDVLSSYPNLVFYDYTKLIGKVEKYAYHPNYFVTFSRAENNEEDCKKALALNVPVAVVFGGKIPEKYLDHVVIDGDKADDLMIDNRSVILALKPKGSKAKNDKSGFVVR